MKYQKEIDAETRNMDKKSTEYREIVSYYEKKEENEQKNVAFKTRTAHRIVAMMQAIKPMQISRLRYLSADELLAIGVATSLLYEEMKKVSLVTGPDTIKQNGF
jgi:hypothetical protein